MEQQMIRLFLAIAAHKNISRAADSLFLSQSTASRRLAELEKELGVELFNRSKGQDRLYMTPQGHEFLAIALDGVVPVEEHILIVLIVFSHY